MIGKKYPPEKVFNISGLSWDFVMVRIAKGRKSLGCKGKEVRLGRVNPLKQVEELIVCRFISLRLPRVLLINY